MMRDNLIALIKGNKGKIIGIGTGLFFGILVLIWDSAFAFSPVCGCRVRSGEFGIRITSFGLLEEYTCIK